jgi:hypothetical protein
MIAIRPLFRIETLTSDSIIRFYVTCPLCNTEVGVFDGEITSDPDKQLAIGFSVGLASREAFREHLRRFHDANTQGHA